MRARGRRERVLRQSEGHPAGGAHGVVKVIAGAFADKRLVGAQETRFERLAERVERLRRPVFGVLRCAQAPAVVGALDALEVQEALVLVGPAVYAADRPVDHRTARLGRQEVRLGDEPRNAEERADAVVGDRNVITALVGRDRGLEQKRQQGELHNRFLITMHY